MTIEKFEEKTKAYALKNAIAYEGKAQQGSVISSLFNEGLKKDEINNYIKKISEIVSEVNSLSLEEQKNEFEKLKEIVSERETREGLPDLPEAEEGKVVMRIAPSASGPLHIGHALTATLSFLFVKKYGGKFYIRIEDTNPENVFDYSYKMIEEDSKWLFENTAEVLIQSERMETYYKYAEELINKEFAYVCTCSQEEFKKFSELKEECPCRNLDIKENMIKWKKMFFENGYKEGEAVLRFKLQGEGMAHKNPAMRDFPLARVNTAQHPLQGSKYRVWPLMNFAVAIDDIEQKMTHIIRGKDHRDNAERQKKIYEALGKKFPWTAFLGRIKFKDLELSTTKMRIQIEEGKYLGWEDERLPTLIALRNKGYKPQAFWEFAERIGLSEADKVMDKKEFFYLLDSFNKEAQNSKK